MGIMAEAAGRYLPALRQQLLDVTDGTPPREYTPTELHTLTKASEAGPLAEHEPERVRLLRRMAHTAAIETMYSQDRIGV